MFFKLLKKSISLALAFSVILSLSCCREGDEILPEETTSAAVTETPPEMTPENIAKALQVTPEELDIMAKLYSNEIKTWKSMPDIVTMRMLKRWDDDGNFLYTEIVYIDKLCNIKKIICPDRPKTIDADIISEWLTERISENEDAELVDVADIHTLIEFYNTFMLVDRNTKFYRRHTIGLGMMIERHYGFEIYGIRDNGENGFETLKIADGNAEDLYIRSNYTDDWKRIDTYGNDTLNLYLELDPFVVPGVGYDGHLANEDV